jgi:hypothetical protein
MCKITPNFYADTMDEEANRLEDEIMMAYFAARGPRESEVRQAHDQRRVHRGSWC